MSAVDVPVREMKGKRWLWWTGWVVSLWPVFVVGMSAHWKLGRNPGYVAEFARIGWPASDLTLLACLQLGSIILFLIPRTAVLGAVLLTGYLGGAVAAYTRMGQPYPVLVPLSTSMIAWLGIWLRDARLRELLPIRRGLARK
ncbi:MAG TPA: DoxX family protein [Candidatus Polarisedimenticolia bacterium]|nr:DoxX family protein [Candidatus Polarisedimenticolia bacterium]